MYSNLCWPGPMTQQTSHIKTYLLIGVMIIAGPLGNVFLGKGMKSIGTLAIWPPPELLQAGWEDPRFGLDLAGHRLANHFFCSLYAGSVMGGLQLRATRLFSRLRSGSAARLPDAGRTRLLHALGRHRSDLPGVFVVGRTNPKTTTHEAETA